MSFERSLSNSGLISQFPQFILYLRLFECGVMGALVDVV
jgi:hypothetical protein